MLKVGAGCIHDKKAVRTPPIKMEQGICVALRKRPVG
jgi:hypothetical protein